MRELGLGAHSSARGQHACQPSSTGTPVIPMQRTIEYKELFRIRGSIVVSISACHAEDPGSIPGRGVLQCTYCLEVMNSQLSWLRGAKSIQLEKGFLHREVILSVCAQSIPLALESQLPCVAT